MDFTHALERREMLREELERGKLRGSEPCECGKFCLCTTRETALRYAQDALESFPPNLSTAAFWTGFAQARAAQG